MKLLEKFHTAYNEQTVITFTGLQVGNAIKFRGNKRAVKKLHGNDCNVLTLVHFLKNRRNIFLELNLYELPKLNEVKFRIRKEKLKIFYKSN